MAIKMYDAENVAFKFSRLRRHCKANKLSLNTIKTELMFIGTTQNITQINNLKAVRVDCRLIKRAKKVKYLGLVIDENMKWD